MFKQSYILPDFSDEFIDNKIDRAFYGISNFKVKNSGKFYALLERRKDGYNFVYQNGKGYWKSKRSLKAMRTIFKGLVFRYYNFECDGVYYYLNRNNGKWMWGTVG